MKKKELVNEICQAIDELSNLKTLGQLKKDNVKIHETTKDLERKAKKQEDRLQQAQLRIQAIEAEEKERCKKTAAILKEFETQSCKGPFFDALLDVLNNFQGKFKKKKRSGNKFIQPIYRRGV